MKIWYKAFDAKEDWNYVYTRAKPNLVDDTCGIVAVDLETNTRVGAAIFDRLTPSGAQVHIMIDNPLVHRHGFLIEAADFVFNYLGKDTCYGLTPENNEPAIKFNKRAEFKPVYTIPDGFKKGVGLVVMQLLKSECSYLPKAQEDKKHG